MVVYWSRIFTTYSSRPEYYAERSRLLACYTQIYICLTLSPRYKQLVVALASSLSFTCTGFSSARSLGCTDQQPSSALQLSNSAQRTIESLEFRAYAELRVPEITRHRHVACSSRCKHCDQASRAVVPSPSVSSGRRGGPRYTYLNCQSRCRRRSFARVVQ